MTSIGPTRFLLAEIRARAGALRRSAPPSGARSASERPGIAAEAQPDLSAVVARAVSAIAPDDPERHRKAFRAYLQAVVARECGFHHPDDPSFQALIDQVQESMGLDPRIEGAMREAGRLLLESAKG
jgi:hypothetical protein